MRSRAMKENNRARKNLELTKRSSFSYELTKRSWRFALTKRT